MASVEVHNLDGQLTGSVDLPDEIFGVEPSESAIYYVVKAYLANQRQGNACTKTRSEIALSKRKMYRQKGTGRARAGMASSPIRVGGGVAHGPKRRSHRERVPKKVRRLALRSAFSLKAAEGGVRVLEDFTLDAPKTRRMAQMSRAIKVDDSRALLLTAECDQTVAKSCRNLPKFSVLPVAQVSPYDVMRTGAVVFTRGALVRARALWGAA